MASTQDFSNSLLLPSNCLLRFHDFVLGKVNEPSRSFDYWAWIAERVITYIAAFIIYPVLCIATAIEKGIDFIAKNLQKSPLHFSTPRSPEEIEPTNLLLTVPLEIQLTIFQHFEIHHLINLSRVNKDYCNTIFYHVLPAFINNNINIPISQLGFNFSCTRELLRHCGNKLNQLCIRGGGLNSAQQLISECPNLRHLKLSLDYCWNSTSCVSPLARTVGELTSLTSLDLSHNRIGQTGILHLLGILTNLTHLNLKDTFFPNSADASTEFTQKLQYLKKLQSLNLSENNLTYYGGIKPIIDAINGNQNLNALNLCDTSISTHDSLYVLRNLPNVVHLDLSENWITINRSQDLIEELLRRTDLSSFTLNLKKGAKPRNEKEQEILTGLTEQIVEKFPECNVQLS